MPLFYEVLLLGEFMCFLSQSCRLEDDRQDDVSYSVLKDQISSATSSARRF